MTKLDNTIIYYIEGIPVTKDQINETVEET